MTITTQALSQLSLFARLNEQALAAILPNVLERAVVGGQIVLIEGEPCQAVYFVQQGLVRTRRLSPDGKEQVLAYFGPGSPFNLVPAVDGRASLATAEAVIDSTLVLIPCERFRQIISQHPQVASAVMQSLAADVRRLSDMVEGLALHTVSTRLARFLLSRAEDAQSPPRRWTQQDIAAHIGTAREMVSRALRSWVKQGLIRRERGRVIIVDHAGLEREAQG